MNGTATGNRRPLLRAPLTALLAAGLAAVLGAPAAGQGTPAIGEMELQYRSARSAHRSALDARAAVDARLQRALREVEAARASGNRDRLERAFAAAQAAALELQGLERRVEEATSRAADAARALLAALDERLELLLVRAQEAPDREERAELAAIIRDLDNRVREVEGDLGTAPLRASGMPEVTFDPRDGPAELRAKAELLERRIAEYRSQVLDIDRQIEDLRRRQRWERGYRDLMAGLERFDDTRVPVGPTSRPPARGDERADGQGRAGGERSQAVTPQDRIDSLQALKGQLEGFIEELTVRARVFRNAAGSVSQ